MKDRLTILSVLAVQALCAVFFVSDIALTVLGIRASPVSWQTRELLEIGAAVGLILGLVLGALTLHLLLKKTTRVQAQLRVASGAFMDLLGDHFETWGLTPAERDVAMFAIKGMSIQEIASLRSTSEGTVKAQTNAIYRKAGVSGRPQLLSLFIDDLVDEALLPASGTKSLPKTDTAA